MKHRLVAGVAVLATVAACATNPAPVVRQGDSWQSIAERSGNIIKASTLAVMNGFETASQPLVGARTKIVVGG